MVYEVKMPKLGLTMEEGRIASWYKNIGDKVEEGEVIAAIETEKLISDIKAPASGILAKIIVPEGETAKVGSVIALIAENEEEFKKLKESKS